MGARRIWATGINPNLGHKNHKARILLVCWIHRPNLGKARVPNLCNPGVAQRVAAASGWMRGLLLLCESDMKGHSGWG